MSKRERMTISWRTLVGKPRSSWAAGIVRLSVAVLGLFATSGFSGGQTVDDARSVAKDPSAAIADRVAAIERLAQDRSNAIGDVQWLAGLLNLRTPLEVQLAAADTLAAFPGEQTTELLLSDWANHGPRVHTAVISHLLWRDPWLGALDRAAEGRPELAASLVWARRDITQRHRSAAARARAQRLLDESSIEPKVQLTVDKFLPSLHIQGSTERGKQVFEDATCSNCHKLDGIGRDLTVDLSRLMDKSPRSMLAHTIDPNRRVDHRYLEYTVVTADGLFIVGMMLNEATDSITFADTKGEEHLVNRAEIDEHACNKRSHMPDGLEARLTVQQMADLLAFMAAAKPESAKQ